MKESKIVQMVFYLNPGDYHRYHSPIDFVAEKRLHVDGLLKPVKISYLRAYKVIIWNLFNF